MGIQSWDDLEPEERDYFANRYKKPKQETNNMEDLFVVLTNLEETMKELDRARFAQVLTILIEREKFR